MATTTKSGGIRKGAGRKAAPIDLKELEILCALHSTDREIADRFGVSVRTLHNRRKEAEFGEVMRRGRARGCGTVRSAQMKLVSAGNAAMGIWLGKNLLGQTGAPSARVVIPKIRTAADYAVAANKVLQDAVRGKITPAHGKDMMNILVSHSTVIATVAIISRVEKIEHNMAAAQGNGTEVVGSPGEERPDEADREAGKPKMSKQNVNRRLERIETAINRESSRPDFIHVEFVDSDGTVASSFLIEADKRTRKRRGRGSKPPRVHERDQPDRDYDSPRLLQKAIELNTLTHRQWMAKTDFSLNYQPYDHNPGDVPNGPNGPTRVQ
jgi:hypothetical protein